jgi:prolyl-tRNA synthetase
MVTGANEKDFHYINVVPNRDFKIDVFGDFRNVVEGDSCPKCEGGKLRSSRGIEVGHIFKLGKKYSSSMKATFLDREGKEREFVMGCYGIGVGRLMAAAVEQSHDDKGIIWQKSIAPFTVVIMPVNWKDDSQRLMAEKLYIDFLHSNIDVILDDRDISPGVKFMDADLIGFPLRIVIGKKYSTDKLVEVRIRKNGEQLYIRPEELVVKVKEILEKI